MLRMIQHKTYKHGGSVSIKALRSLSEGSPPFQLSKTPTISRWPALQITYADFEYHLPFEHEYLVLAVVD
jgi:hypothetical protein